jgi:hypothetical protein
MKKIIKLLKINNQRTTRSNIKVNLEEGLLAKTKKIKKKPGKQPQSQPKEKASIFSTKNNDITKKILLDPPKRITRQNDNEEKSEKIVEKVIPPIRKMIKKTSQQNKSESDFKHEKLEKENSEKEILNTINGEKSPPMMKKTHISKKIEEGKKDNTPSFDANPSKIQNDFIRKTRHGRALQKDEHVRKKIENDLIELENKQGSNPSIENPKTSLEISNKNKSPKKRSPIAMTLPEKTVNEKIDEIVKASSENKTNETPSKKPIIDEQPKINIEYSRHLERSDDNKNNIKPAHKNDNFNGPSPGKNQHFLQKKEVRRSSSQKNEKAPIEEQEDKFGALEKGDIPHFLIKHVLMESVAKFPGEERSFLVAWKERKNGEIPLENYENARKIREFGFSSILLDYYEKNAKL